MKTMDDDLIIKSPLEIEVQRDISLPDFILNKSKIYEKRAALIDGLSGSSYTYSDLPEIVEGFSASLWRLGLRKGDRVCVISHNCIEFAVVYFAVMKLGGIIACLNPLDKKPEMERYINELEPSMMVASTETLKNLSQYLSLHKQIRSISLTKGTSNSDVTVHSLIEDGRKTGVNLNEKVHINPQSDPATICYSSGTTGSPKGCVHVHYSFICHVAQMCMKDEPVSYMREGRDVIVIAVPLFHAYGQMSGLLSALYMGLTIVLMPRFNIDTYLRVVNQYKATVLLCAPPIVAGMVARGCPSDLRSVRVVVCSAAPLSDHVIQGVKNKLPHVSIINEYGMTEVMGIYRSLVIASESSQSRIGCRLAPSVLAKVTDMESGKSLGPHREGELWIKTRCRVKEYWKNPEDSKRYIIRDGWFRTGDVAYYDDESNLRIVDRSKDLIKYNGYQVSPTEVEEIILSHPAVFDAAVVGRKHEICGELPTAFVVKKQSKDYEQVSEQELCEFVAERVSPQKKLRGGVFFTTSIPKSPSGKVLRLVLRNSIQSRDVKDFRDSTDKEEKLKPETLHSKL